MTQSHLEQHSGLVIFDDGTVAGADEALFRLGVGFSLRGRGLAQLVYLANHEPERLHGIDSKALYKEGYDVSTDPEGLFVDCPLPLLSKHAVISEGRNANGNYEIVELKQPYISPTTEITLDGILSQHYFGNFAFKSSPWLQEYVPNAVTEFCPEYFDLQNRWNKEDGVRKTVRDLCYDAHPLRVGLSKYLSNQEVRKKAGELALLMSLHQVSYHQTNQLRYPNSGAYLCLLARGEKKGKTFEWRGKEEKDIDNLHYSDELSAKIGKAALDIMWQHAHQIQELIQ